MDYAKFLGKSDRAVLAYLGGPHVHLRDRRVRIEGPRPPVGWHAFEIRGRAARALEPASPVVDGLARVRGHWAIGLLASERLERVHLVPSPPEPLPFAVLRARRWYSGDLVFESFDFDGEAEEAARLAFERLASISNLKGAAASLRLAYSAAHAGRGATGLRPLSPEACADGVFRDDPLARAGRALAVAGAHVLFGRALTATEIEVAFDFLGHRFVSVADAETLRVLDAGVCLAGEDELVTLESLPAVLRQAIDEHVLVITRH